MTGTEHLNAVLKLLLEERPWLNTQDLTQNPKGRFARIWIYRADVSLQVLFSTGGANDCLEVGFAFDNKSREINADNLAEFRERLGTSEQKLRLVLRPGKGDKLHYLMRTIPLDDPPKAHRAAADLLMAILDLVLGSPVSQAGYRRLRDAAPSK